MKRLLIITFTLLAFVAAGCGIYTFSPKGKSDIQSVSVERFENETAQYGLEDRMTDQIADALLAEGTLKVLSAEYADAILYGTLTRYDRSPHGYDESDQVQTYAISMTFDILLRKASDETEIWKETVVQKGIYDLASETEEDGQQKAIELLVEDIINKTTKSW